MSTYAPRLKANDEAVPQLLMEFKYKSSMQVPRPVKIAVNQGLGSFGRQEYRGQRRRGVGRSDSVNAHSFHQELE
ncbi:MAG: hypothetical protein IPL86_07160 [Flavobacteriales bacterium]|nr:hypothetical protein [Flavobacteriales bacterium]